MNKQKLLYEFRVFILMLLVVSSLRSALADWNDVPTGSMKPTIEEGDRVVVNKLAYDLKIPFTTIEIAKWADPHRGDIVVLYSPADGTRLVKRVVAIPGDRVAMLDNKLHINGRLVPWKIDGSRMDDEQGLTWVGEELLDGHLHQVMFTPGSSDSAHSFAPRVVPAGFYFVMGDNRDNSNDSRFIGLIPRDQIVGRALAVAFSFDHAHHFAPRFSRFFTAIR